MGVEDFLGRGNGSRVQWGFFISGRHSYVLNVSSNSLPGSQRSIDI